MQIPDGYRVQIERRGDLESITVGFEAPIGVVRQANLLNLTLVPDIAGALDAMRAAIVEDAVEAVERTIAESLGAEL